ncbi:hypothetical protein Tcan_09355 [Toxocara canis]|uniref:Uncharacterized protein n=1 Tax=Toxocara canis TaxID=6265 RepID=A0A0B2V046_TOXCA|nr:hypothetical protein Tcan_09355 [Toxocara canis]
MAKVATIREGELFVVGACSVLGCTVWVQRGWVCLILSATSRTIIDITFATTMSKKANFSLDVKALAIELAPLLIPLLTQHIADSLKSLFSEQHEQLLSKMDQLIAATTR